MFKYWIYSAREDFRTMFAQQPSSSSKAINKVDTKSEVKELLALISSSGNVCVWFTMILMRAKSVISNEALSEATLMMFE